MAIACRHFVAGNNGRRFMAGDDIVEEAEQFQPIWYPPNGEGSKIISTTIDPLVEPWRQGDIVDGVGDPLFVPLDQLKNEIHFCTQQQ